MAGKKAKRRKTSNVTAKTPSTNKAGTKAKKRKTSTSKVSDNTPSVMEVIGPDGTIIKPLITPASSEHHELTLTPISEHQCKETLKNELGVSATPDKEHKEKLEDGKKQHPPLMLKLPVDIPHSSIEDEDDDEEEDAGSSDLSSPIVKYCRYDDENKVSVIMKLGRVAVFGVNNHYVSRNLCFLELDSNAEACVIMCKDVEKRMLHINGRPVTHPAGEKIQLQNGSVLSLIGPTGLAYRVEIRSKVLDIRNRLLERIDNALDGYTKCPICQDEYDVDDPSNRVLKGTCNHNMCEDCLDNCFADLVARSGSNRRFMDCPLCKRERAYDKKEENKVEDLLLRDLLRARKCSSTGDNVHVNPEEARLRAEVTRLRAESNQLRKLRLENAQLKQRNEELESQEDEEEVEDEDSLQESETRSQEQHQTEPSNATEPPPPPPPNKWACSVCTYYNNIRRKTCEMRPYGCPGKRV